MWSCWKWQNVLKYRTGDREISIRAFIRRKGRFRERFDFHSLPPLRFPPADKTRSHEKNLGSSLVYKIPKFRSPLLPVNFPERDPLGFSCKNRGTVQEKTNSETRNFWNSTTPRWFLFSLSLPFFLLCSFTYDLQKERKKEKKLFRLFRQKFSTKYFSRHDGCLVSPVVRKGFSVAGSGNERNGGTGRRSSSSNWFKLVAGTIPVLLHANVNTHPSRMPRVVLMPSNYLLIFLLFIFPFD